MKAALGLIQLQQQITESKRLCLSGKKLLSPAVRQCVSQGWLRSRGLNIPHTGDALPATQDKEATIKSTSKLMQYHYMKFEKLFKDMDQALGAIGAAVFYLNKNLRVYNKGGNREFLRELKRLNISFGACFSEQMVGSTAVSLASRSRKLEFTIGAENYCEALSAFALFCLPPINNPMMNETSMLVIIPLRRLSEQTLSVVSLSIESFLMLSNRLNLPEVDIKDRVLESVLNQRSSIFISVDTDGNILDASDSFYRDMGTNISEIGGKKFSEVYPALKDGIKCLNGGADITSKSVVMPVKDGGEREYMVDFLKIRSEEKQPRGLAIVMTDRKALQKYINKVSNTGPAFTFDKLIGKSDVFERTVQQARSAAAGNSNILIFGESGTGKELFAQSLHNESSRRSKPFVAINCAALPRELLSTELFGYEEGAFTGAKRGGAMGKFEAADGGTLFLDEIAEIPLDMQVLLLRVLEDGVVTRVGGNRAVATDVRVISATNKDLWEYVNDGKFRLDLYYRLNVFTLNIPPLRDRKSDIPLLIDYMLDGFSRSFGKRVTGVSDEVLELMMSYDWPGNVRELRNVIERCMNVTASEVITSKDLPLDFHSRRMRAAQPLPAKPAEQRPEPEPGKTEPLKAESYGEYERELIMKLMIAHRGNKSAVASEMGISRKTLYAKLEKYKI